MAKIGLIDVDGRKFPNLALMKLSAWHKSKGDDVEWWWSNLEYYDIVYMSKVFSDTYSPDVPEPYNAGRVVKGGTGYAIRLENGIEAYKKELDAPLPDEVEKMYPDYSLYDSINQEAHGFLTRGCPCNCNFCIVGKKEGLCSCKRTDLNGFWDNQKTVKLFDPNLLACKDHMDLIGQLQDSKAVVDFTQGLDARRITTENAKELAKVKTTMVHFAFDFMRNEKQVCRGLEIYKNETNIDSRKTGVYILTNFDTTHEQDLYRVKRVQELGYLPYVMVYNKPSAPQVTRDLQRWSNNRFIYQASNGDFAQYKKNIQPDFDGQMTMEV